MRFIFKYQSVHDVAMFLSRVKILSYSMDARTMQFTCYGCPEVKAMAERYGLQTIGESETRERSSDLNETVSMAMAS